MEALGLIVVLDEADKICCETAIGSTGTDYNAIIQNSLLKMLDGLQVGGKYRVTIDDGAADLLSRQAASSGLGVRWMRSQVMNAVDDMIFENPTEKLYTVRIAPDSPEEGDLSGPTAA